MTGCGQSLINLHSAFSDVCISSCEQALAELESRKLRLGDSSSTRPSKPWMVPSPNVGVSKSKNDRYGIPF